MQYRRFGRTEIQMPVLSCGGMRYQYKWKDVPPEEVTEESQSNVEAIVKKAFDNGINHFETARGYGTSEMQLSTILPKYKRDELIVQTKVAPFEEPEKFRKVAEKSFRMLGLDHVDLFSLHGVNTAELLEWTLRPGGCLDIAREFQREGRVRHIGFSTHAPTDVIVEAIESDAFDYVNLHWYYISQNNWLAVQAAAKHDMGVFIISPSDKGGHLYNPPDRLVELCEPVSPIVFNDLFCLSRPEVHTLSIGAARPADFDEHLRAVEQIEKTDQLIPPIVERLEGAIAERFGNDWAENYAKGLPSFDKTPGEVNLPVLLWLRNLTLAYGMTEYAKARYNLLGNGGHWFPGGNLEKLDELDLTEALADSPFKDQIPGILAEMHELLAGKALERLSKSS